MTQGHDKLEPWLRIASVPGLDAARLAPLLDRLGGPEGVAAAPAARLESAGLPASMARALAEPGDGPDRAARWLEGPGRRLVPWGHPRYPDLLARIPDPPAALFVEGDPEALSLPAIAMVGSRRPSPEGRRNARSFARFLSSRGLVVTSGFAAGIDSAAHSGAIEGGGRTVAVLGTGPDLVYPAGQEPLAAAVAASGALVSALPPGTPPRRENFPRRNRIISGLSMGVLVVEAARRSGSLITARLAAEQGREVFALPGSIHNPMARGCHRLIRDGARLTESAEDLFEELGPLLGAALQPVAESHGTPAPESPSWEPDEDYSRVLDAMGWGPVTVDDLHRETRLTASELSSMLLILELHGAVESGPGATFFRVPQRANV